MHLVACNFGNLSSAVSGKMWGINLLFIKGQVNVSMDIGGKNKKSDAVPNRDDEVVDSSGEVLLELVNPGEYVLGYTFFLIPEIASCQLTGELAELLSESLKKICTSNGWKLEFVAVDPKYIQWALSVPAVVATGQIIQQVRSKLTEQILINFKGKFETKDPADFWAQGYLLIHGLSPRPVEIIEQYIRLIRQQQKKMTP